MTPKKVFISYSHDSPEHSERVLSLAWALRNNGIDVDLDQFHKEEIFDWPRWCNEQTSREHSEFVVCVCTAEYKRRLDGQAPPEKGKGVYWEGSLISIGRGYFMQRSLTRGASLPTEVKDADRRMILPTLGS